jgi:SAM-dependent methyltransferase
MVDDARRFAPASARNRGPILEVLRRFVTPGANVLEIASGSGEHAVFLAPALGVAAWQPSDPDEPSRLSIDAWRRHAGATSVRPAIDLDVTKTRRPSLPFEAADVVVCINMIHIAPWAAAEALFDCAAEVLASGGLLYLYGPYKRGGGHTAPSNEAFDESLRSRNPAWGVRDLEAVTAAAETRGLGSFEVAPMPANNLSVLFRSRAPK